MDQLEYYRSHPPRCIREFRLNSTTFPDAEFDGHGEELNPAFSLNCLCGGDAFLSVGYQVPYSEGTGFITLSPISLECCSCGKHTELLDTDLHGYDAELGHGSSNRRAEGSQTKFSCITCSKQPLNVFMRFEYPGDLFDEGFNANGKSPEDLFTWVTVVGRCIGCQSLWIVADFECA